MPYPGLYLIQYLNSKSPNYHYPEVASYLMANPVTKSVYIHTAPIYLSLVIIAIVPKNVSVIISDTYPEK